MKRSRINPIGKKRKASMRVYSITGKAFLEENPICQRCNQRESTEVHHKAGRSGNNYLDTSTWLAACNDCHTQIHAYPSAAREQGYITN